MSLYQDTVINLGHSYYLPLDERNNDSARNLAVPTSIHGSYNGTKGQGYVLNNKPVITSGRSVRLNVGPTRDGYIELPGIAFVGSVGIHFWYSCPVDTPAGAMGIFSLLTSSVNDGSLNLTIDAAGKWVFTHENDAYTFDDAPDFITTGKRFVAITYEYNAGVRETARLYIDGVLVDEVAVSAPANTTTTGDFIFGAVDVGSGPANFSTITVDEISLLLGTNANEAEEILQLYNAGCNYVQGMAPFGEPTFSGGNINISTPQNSIVVQEVDGSPSASNVTTLKVSNGSLTKTDENTVTITIPDAVAGLTVEEEDASPSVDDVTTLKFPNGSVTDNGGGSVSVAFASSLTVEELDTSPSVSDVTTIRVPNGNLSSFGSGVVGIDCNQTLTVQEEDGSPISTNIGTLRFPNGSITDNGGDDFSIAFPSAASLTVEEQDGSPSVSDVNTIKFTNAKVTDDGSGVVSVDISGVPLTSPVADADTVGLWTLVSDGTDTSGNGNDLTINSGAHTVAPGVIPGAVAFHTRNSKFYKSAAGVSDLLLLGAFTLSFDIFLVNFPNSSVISYGNSSTSQPNNTAYGFGFSASGDLQYFSEHGSGVSSNYTSAIARIRTAQWARIDLTRNAAATDIAFYLNGGLADTQTGLTAPDGGTTANLWVAANTGSTPTDCIIANVHLRNRELSASEILEDVLKYALR